MQDYRVELDAYNGPLDLLLYLVRRHEIDLYDIPVAKLTEQYLEHLKLIRQINVDLAGEFLVMAATLLEIKSAMLVPQSAATDQATAGGDSTVDALSAADPRYELVQQLLAYKRFKDAANDLDARRDDWQQRFARVPAKTRPDPVEKSLADYENEYENQSEPDAGDMDIDLEDVHILDLCEAFARILETIGTPSHHQVTYDDTPISLHAEDILDRLQRDAAASGGSMTLQQIFVGRTNRGELIGLFLATLELVRQKRVRVVQDQAAGEIRLELRPEQEQLRPEDDKPADWRDPVTGEVQYEWPSEAEQHRADKRERLRALRAAKGQFGEPTEEELAEVEPPAQVREDQSP